MQNPGLLGDRKCKQSLSNTLSWLIQNAMSTQEILAQIRRLLSIWKASMDCFPILSTWKVAINTLTSLSHVLDAQTSTSVLQFPKHSSKTKHEPGEAAAWKDWRHQLGDAVNRQERNSQGITCLIPTEERRREVGLHFIILDCLTRMHLCFL